MTDDRPEHDGSIDTSNDQSGAGGSRTGANGGSANEGSASGTDTKGADANGGSGNRGNASAAAGPCSRRRLLAGAGATAVAGLAGCSGILGGGDDSGDDSVGGSDQTIRSEVDGLEITDATSEIRQAAFTVTLTVENTGGEDTGILDYSYRLTLYDSEGSEIQFRGTSARNLDGFFDDDTGRVRLEPAWDGDPERIDSYDARIVCDGFADGVYCEG